MTSALTKQTETSFIFLNIYLVWSAGSVPVPLRNLGEEHNIDNANEVHHDKFVKDVPNLVMDALPNQQNSLEKDSLLQTAVAGHMADDAREGEDEDEESELDFDHEMAQHLKKLDLDKLIPVDHMDVVKMEQDGHMNKEYHKEMFLGGQHDEFKTETVDYAEGKLQEVVSRADRDGDGELSLGEMEDWILEKMHEHFAEARRENDHIFKHLDPDGDGSIKWKEYYVHFLLSRGFDLDNSLMHIQDYGDSVQLSQEDKNSLISYKLRWHDADADPKDNKLNKDEFMTFRHPEHSKRSLESMAQNVLRGVDTNEDGIITMEEFTALPPGEVENKEYEEMDRKWQEERKTEFRDIMDTDHNGKVDMNELKVYLDPTNPIQAKLEAQSLMSLMDDNKDGSLAMKEIIKHSDIFVSSKIVNFAANVHDEF